MSVFEKSLVGIAALLPAYLIRFSVLGIPTTLLEVLIWLTFLLGLLKPSIRQSWVKAWQLFSLPRVALAKWGVFFFLFSAVLSTAISPHLHTSLGILKGWIIAPLVYGFMVYAVIRTSPRPSPNLGEGDRRSGEVRHRIIRALIFSAVIMALLGISQIGTLDRIRGVFDVPNSLALFLAPIAVLTAFSARQSPHRFLFSLFFFLIAFAIIFTQSLAGVLSVLIVVGLSLCFGFWKLKPVWVLGFGLWALSAIFILMPKINYLLQPNSSAAVRLQLWSISWDLIKEHPVLGIGLGEFEPAYQNALHQRFEKIENRKEKIDEPLPLREFVFRDPHSWILSFWLNLGLLGLASFAFLNGYALWKSARNPVALALLALFIFGFVDTIYWKNDLATLHWLLLALVVRRKMI